ncbi:MAG TPA: hypothetical protein VHM16_04340 [Rubrobacteraceae bacterium]|nr:hypothetical protein [Rubrobacteraceae bacterium]
MRKTRVLLANEPRSYREVMASAFREMRPNLEVFVADPDEVERILDLISPDVVICSEPIPAVQHRVRAWIELYPAGESLVVVNVEGERSTFDDLELLGLLSIVDDMGEKLQHTNQGCAPTN